MSKSIEERREYYRIRYHKNKKNKNVKIKRRDDGTFENTIILPHTEIIDKYSRGTSASSIGREYNVDCSSIIYILKNNGIEIRQHNMFGSNNACFTGYMEILGCRWGHIKANAKRRKLDFNITIEYAWELFIKQNRKCALSGVELFFAKTSKDHSNGGGSASLDRIDSSKGYIEGNLQWIHKDIQKMKMDKEQRYFLDLCHKISAYNKGE